MAPTPVDALGTRLAAARRRLAPAISARVGIDARAIAAFRIALGALILADLLRRARNLTAFYTDAGVLPRSALYSDYGSVYSLHATWGSTTGQAAMFVLAGLFALALLVGYRSRLAAFGSWVLLLSLHARNPMVLNGGDLLFRMWLFWAVFLPLGERYSLDALRRERPARRRIASVATAAVLGQLVIVYWANADFKLGGEKWLAGEAVSYALSLGQFTVFLGDVVSDWYLLHVPLTYFWMALLIGAPLLVLLTGWLRAGLAGLFAGMHLGMLLTMRLDLFPLIVIAGILLFLPPRVWDRVEGRLDSHDVRQRTRSGVARLARPLPEISVPTPDIPSKLRLACRVALGGVVVFFFALVLLTNLASADVAEVPDPADQVLDATGTHQHWQLFAPNPKGSDAWFVVPGDLANGSQADLFRGGAVDFDRPPDVSNTYPSARWRKYLSNVWGGGNTNHRSYLANYLCDRWNRTHDVGVTDLELYVVAQPSQPFAPTEPTERHLLKDYDCDGPLVQY